MCWQVIFDSEEGNTWQLRTTASSQAPISGQSSVWHFSRQRLTKAFRTSAALPPVSRNMSVLHSAGHALSGPTVKHEHRERGVCQREGLIYRYPRLISFYRAVTCFAFCQINILVAIKSERLHVVVDIPFQTMTLGSCSSWHSIAFVPFTSAPVNAPTSVM